jgi:hypothetical protein
VANSATASVATPSLAHSRPFPAIVVGGVIVGMLDLAYAIVVYSFRHPILIPQTIASGVLGLKSYQEGVLSAALGVLLHFVIALGAASVYYLASRKLTFLVRRAVPFGLLYGTAVYLFMHRWCCHSRPCRVGTPRRFTWSPSSSSTGSAWVCRSLSRSATIRADLLAGAAGGFVRSCRPFKNSTSPEKFNRLCSRAARPRLRPAR